MRLFFHFTLIFIFFLFGYSLPSLAMEKIFYVLHHKPDATRNKPISSFTTMTKQNKHINILISQAYQVQQDGSVSGFLDEEVVNFVRNNKNLKLMAMVTNANFNKDTTHTFLTNRRAQEKAINALIELCHQQHLYGVQFDFEMMPHTDREILTAFYQLAAEKLHQQRLAVSFAVAPILTDSEFASAFQQRIYENWAGAYDIGEIGKSADFITIMAYNQHVGKMTPGPNASISWVEQVIKYALKHVPARKLSLGIPAYSGVWYMGINPGSTNGKVSIQHDEISYQKALALLAKNHAKQQWNASGKFYYAFYENRWANQYVFIEDAKSFKEKVKLAKKYKLRGISVFRIGTEDPAIWRVLQ